MSVRCAAEALDGAAPHEPADTPLVATVKQAIATFDWQHSEPLTLTLELGSDPT